MKIAIDGVVAVLQPGTIGWEAPRVKGHSGESAPVLMPYWRCRLGFGTLTKTDGHSAWHNAWDGEPHTFTLPHPRTGELTDFSGCYIDSISPRMSLQEDCAVVSGVDVAISHIQVT